MSVVCSDFYIIIPDDDCLHHRENLPVGQAYVLLLQLKYTGMYWYWSHIMQQTTNAISYINLINCDQPLLLERKSIPEL